MSVLVTPTDQHHALLECDACPFVEVVPWSKAIRRAENHFERCDEGPEPDPIGPRFPAVVRCVAGQAAHV